MKLRKKSVVFVRIYVVRVKSPIKEPHRVNGTICLGLKAECIVSFVFGSVAHKKPREWRDRVNTGFMQLVCS